MPKIVLNPYRNNLSISGLTLRHDELLDQPVLHDSSVSFNSITVGNLVATGDVLFTGRISEIETEHVLIKDNIIDINVDNDTPLLTGGIRIQRGPGLVPFDILYDERDGLFKVGKQGSMQAFATREANPTDNFIAVWDASKGYLRTTDNISAPVTFANHVDILASLAFGNTELAPYMSGNSAGDLFLDAVGDIILGSLGSSSYPSGTSPGKVLIPENRKLFLGQTSNLSSDSAGALTIDSPRLIMSNLTQLGWNDAILYSSNEGNDVNILADNIHLDSGFAVDLVRPTPLSHAGVGKLQPLANGTYEISSVGDLVLRSSSPTGNVVLEKFSLERKVLFATDLVGNFYLDSLSDMYLTPKANIILNAGKSLCFTDPLSSINIATNGDLTLNSNTGLTLNGKTQVYIPGGVPLNLASGTSFYERPDGVTCISSYRNITFLPGVNKNVVLPVNVPLQFGSGEKIVSDGTSMNFVATSKISLNAPLGVGLPQGIPLTFGGDLDAVWKDVAGNVNIRASLSLILSAVDRVMIPNGILSLGGNCEIKKDLDGALTLSSGSSGSSSIEPSFVRVKEQLLVASTDEATEEKVASIMTAGGCYIEKNLIVSMGSYFKSEVNVANAIVLSSGALPVRIANASSIDGTAISITSSWDYTGSYTIGRGTFQSGGGRSFLFTVPSFLSYGIGTKPSFVFGTAAGNTFLSVDEDLVHVRKHMTIDLSCTIAGETSVQDLTAASTTIGQGSLAVTQELVHVASSLLVDNGVVIRETLDGGSSKELFSLTAGSSMQVATDISVTGNAAFTGDLVAGTITANGGIDLNGTFDARYSPMKNFPLPVADNDPATKMYVDNVARGQTVLESVKAASTANVPLSTPVSTLDGIALVQKDRILLKNQTDPRENGIYIVPSGIPFSGTLQRSTDFPVGADVSTCTVFTRSGATNGSIVYTVVSSDVIVGTSQIIFTESSGGLSTTNVDLGLEKTGNTISVRVDDFSLKVNNGNKLEVAREFFGTGFSGGSFGGSFGGTLEEPLRTSTDQSHVEKVGTIIAGTWNGNMLQVPFGGLGVSHLQPGQLLLGNGTSPVQSTDKIIISGETGNIGIGTAAPNAKLHISSSTPGTGSWLHLQDTSSGFLQSSGVRITGNNGNTGRIFLQENGTLTIAQDDTTSASSIVFSTQTFQRMQISHTGKVTIGLGVNIVEDEILLVYGKATFSRDVDINGILSFPEGSSTISSLLPGLMIVDTDILSILGDLQIDKSATIGNMVIFSEEDGIILRSNDVPMILQTTSSGNVSAVCSPDRFIVPAVLQVGGSHLDELSGFTMSSTNETLTIASASYSSSSSSSELRKILIDEKLYSSKGIFLVSGSSQQAVEEQNAVSMSLQEDSLFIKSQIITAPHANLIIGKEGTTEMITSLMNKAGTASVTYDPRSAQLSGGVFSVSNNILVKLGNEVRISGVLRYGSGSFDGGTVEGVLQETGWYFLGDLGLGGRTTITLASYCTIFLNHVSPDVYAARVFKLSDDVDEGGRTFRIYKTPTGTFKMFIRILTGPCKVSVSESKSILYLDAFEGSGSVPNGVHSSFSPLSFTLDFDLDTAQSNVSLSVNKILSRQSSNLNNSTLTGTTVIDGDITFDGSASGVKYKGSRHLFINGEGSIMSVLSTADENSLTIHGSLEGSSLQQPTLKLQRDNHESIMTIIPANELDNFASSLLVKHSSLSPSQIVFAHNDLRIMSISSSGTVAISSTLDSFETSEVSLLVKGGSIFEKGLLSNGSIIGTKDIILENEEGRKTGLCSSSTGHLSLLVSADGSRSQLKNVADPLDPNDAVNLGTMANFLQGFQKRTSVTAATTGENIPLDLLVTVLDGATVREGDRILVKDQTDALENGIYEILYGAPPRRTLDFLVGTQGGGTFIFISTGMINAHTGWVSTSSSNSVVGVDPLHFTQFSAAGLLDPGKGLEKIGNVLSVIIDGRSLEIGRDNSLQVSSTIAGKGLSGGSSLPLSVTDISHLSTLGTITSGTWKGDTIPVEHGGTGKTHYSIGRIPFSNGTSLTQGNLFFDDVNARLGVNTLTPTSGLTVANRDIEIVQSFAYPSYLILTSSITGTTFALRNENSAFTISSGTSGNKTALIDKMTLDSTGTLNLLQGGISAPWGIISGSSLEGSSSGSSGMRYIPAGVEKIGPGPFTFKMFSADNSSTVMQLYGARGNSMNDLHSEFLRAGYLDGKYVIQTGFTGLGSGKNLSLQASGNTDQILLKENGTVNINGPVLLTSLLDAVSTSNGGSLTVAGGMAVGGTIHAKKMVLSDPGLEALSVLGGMNVAGKLTFLSQQDYTIFADLSGTIGTSSLLSGSLNIVGTRNSTDTVVNISSRDGNNANNVLFRIFGFGASSSGPCEFLQMGYEKMSACYIIRTTKGSLGTHRPLVLSAKLDGSQQIFLDVDGSIIMENSLTVKGPVIFTCTDDLSTGASFPALQVAGSSTVTGSMIVGSRLQVPVQHVSSFTEHSRNGSLDRIFSGYSGNGQYNLYNNSTTTVNIHTGSSTGPFGQQQEKLVLGENVNDPSCHVIASVSTGSLQGKDLVLETTGNIDQLRLKADGTIEFCNKVLFKSLDPFAVHVSGSLVVDDSLSVKNLLTVGSGADTSLGEMLMKIASTATWAMYEKNGTCIDFRPVDIDSTFSFSDVSGSPVFSIDALNGGKIISTRPTRVATNSVKAFSVQDASENDRFVFDTTTHTLSLTGGRLTNVANPQLGTDGVNLATLHNLVKGLNLKYAVLAASVANVDLMNPLTTTDDIPLSPGDRVLLMDQTNAVENGIYVLTQDSYLVRSDDFAVGTRSAGAFTFVQQGTFRGDKGYVCIADNPSLVGTDILNFTQFNGNIISAGRGMEKDGNNVLNVLLDPHSGLGFNGGKLRVDPVFAGNGLTITDGTMSLLPITELATVTSGTWNADTHSISVGGTGATSFPTNSLIFSQGSFLTGDAEKLAFSNVDGLFINNPRHTYHDNDGLTLRDKDVTLQGTESSLSWSDAYGYYNWALRRTSSKSFSAIPGFSSPVPWISTTFSKSGTTGLILSEASSPLYITRNSGEQWTRILDDGILHVFSEAVFSFSGSVILICASEEFLYISHDYGETFFNALTDIPRVWEWSGISDNGQYMLASSLADGMFSSNDSGITWRSIGNVPTDPVDLGFVHVGKDGSVQWAGYFGGPLYTSRDYGATFAVDGNVPAGNYWDLIEAKNAPIVSLFSYPGYIYVSTDFGLTWSEKMNDIPRKWISLSMSDDGKIIAAAEENGFVFLSKDYGASWATIFNVPDAEGQQGSFIPQHWTFVTVVPDGSGLYAGGSQMPLYVTYDLQTVEIASERNMNIPVGAYSASSDTLFFAEHNGSFSKHTFVPATHLVLSGGQETSKSSLQDFLVFTDKKLVGIGYTEDDALQITNTLDVKGSFSVSGNVSLGQPLSVQSGGTGTGTIPAGIILSNGSNGPMQSTGGLPSGAVPIGSSTGTGEVVLESGSVLRSHLGLGIGTQVQAHGKLLDDISSLTPVQGSFIMGTGTSFIMGTVETASTTMGLGRLAYLENVNNNYFSGDPLSVSNGGTGSSLFSEGTIPMFRTGKLDNSILSYDGTTGTNGRIAIDGSLSATGTGLQILASDISLVPAINTQASSILFHLADASCSWRLYRKDEGSLSSASSFVLAGGSPEMDKNALVDRMIISSSGSVTITGEQNAAPGQGSLVLHGGVSMAGNMYAAGKMEIADTTLADGETGALVIAGGISTMGNLYVSEETVLHRLSVTDTTDATGSTGSITTAGGILVAGKIHCKGTIVLQREGSTIGQRAQGLTLGVSSTPWTAGAALTDEERTLSLVSDGQDSQVSINMRNLQGSSCWDMIVPGSTDTLIFQSTNLATGSVETWATLSPTIGTLSLFGTGTGTGSSSALYLPAGGISCFGPIRSSSGMFLQENRNSSLAIHVANLSNKEQGKATLLLENNLGTAELSLHSGTFPEKENLLLLRNDTGSVGIKSASGKGLTVSSSTGSVSVDDKVIISSVEDAISKNTGGALTVLGGGAFGKTVHIGGDLHVTGTITGLQTVSNPTVSAVPEDTVNVSQLTVYKGKLVTINGVNMLTLSIKVVPTAPLENTQFTFNLPGRSTPIADALDISGHTSGFTDGTNLIVLQNMLCTGVPGTTKAVVKFQSSSEGTVHNVSLFLVYEEVLA
jgi:hypothetical protein